MILHTLSAAPSSTAYSDCVRLLGKGDSLLMLGDGVYAALSGTKACAELLDTQAELFVLQADATAAGILSRTDPEVRIVDIDAFAALTEQFTRQQAWY